MNLAEAQQAYEERVREAALGGKRLPAWAHLSPEQRALAALLICCDSCGRALCAACAICDNDE